MSVIAVIGAQWGDEGKGKVVDMLAARVKMVIRFSGGDNAGHTVINPLGEFKLHLVPSGIFYPGVTCIIGSGTVINPARLIEEIDNLNRCGVDTGGLVISDRAHLVMPYHILLDGLEEDARGGKALGTTRRGIGPAFTDKTARVGIRAGELLFPQALRQRLEEVLEAKNAIITRIYGAPPLSVDEIFQQYCGYAARLSVYIKDTTVIMRDARRRGDSILLEGAQGAMLDPDYGTYPYTTSSSPLAGGACLGAGIGPAGLDRILGVFKAYCTRVGAGPMPTELNDETGHMIRQRAWEYGTTTGRPRRCGWFDGVAAGLSSQVNGFTGIAITRLDVLDTLPCIKICTAYEFDGRKIDFFPAAAAELERCKPIYEEFAGWQADITGIRSFNKLPSQAKAYIRKLEEIVGCPADLVCVGPSREQSIEINPLR